MRVAAEWFVDLCKGTETRRCRPIAHVLPGDAVLVDSKITEMGTVILVIQSGTFPEVEEASIMAELPPTEFEVVRSKGNDREHERKEMFAAFAQIKASVNTAEHAYGQIVGLDEWAALERLI